MSDRDDPNFYKALVDFDPEAIARIEGTPALDQAQHEANKLDREQHKNQPGCLGAMDESEQTSIPKATPEDREKARKLKATLERELGFEVSEVVLDNTIPEGTACVVSRELLDPGREKTEPEDQPMPVVNTAPFIHDLVAEDARWSNYTELARDIEARGELGKRRYGTKLQANNGRLSAKDAYEELLDAACYLRQVFEETRDVKWHARYQEVLVLAGAVRRSLPM